MKIITGLAFCATALLAADAKLKITDLPAAAQKSAQEQLKGAELVGLSKEVEKGKTLFEMETKVNGKTRDLMIDTAGVVLSVEEEVEISTIPAAAKAAIEKKATGGKVTKVETLSKAGRIVAYEAALMKGTKASEVAVTAAGAPYKD